MMKTREGNEKGRGEDESGVDFEVGVFVVLIDANGQGLLVAIADTTSDSTLTYLDDLLRNIQTNPYQGKRGGDTLEGQRGRE